MAHGSDGIAFRDGKYVGRDEAKISVIDLSFSRSDVAYAVVSTRCVAVASAL